MPLLIDDEATSQLVTTLARLRGLSPQDAVRLAVQAELDRPAPTSPPVADTAACEPSLRERFAALRQAHPLPPATGEAADKAFFDALSGEA